MPLVYDGEIMVVRPRDHVTLVSSAPAADPSAYTIQTVYSYTYIWCHHGYAPDYISNLVTL